MLGIKQIYFGGMWPRAVALPLRSGAIRWKSKIVRSNAIIPVRSGSEWTKMTLNHFRIKSKREKDFSKFFGMDQHDIKVQ